MKRQAAELYIIGGETTMGKTELARRLRSGRSFDSVSSDMGRRMLWNFWNEQIADPNSPLTEADRPKPLFRMFEERKEYADDADWIRENKTNPLKFIASRAAQSNYVFENVLRSAIASAMERGIDTVGEGIGYRPSAIRTLRGAHPLRAIVLGNQDAREHTTQFERSIEETPNHWAARWSWERRSHFVEQLTIGSRLLEMDCERRADSPAIEYFEMGGIPEDEVFEAALEVLTKQTEQYYPPIQRTN